MRRNVTAAREPARRRPSGSRARRPADEGTPVRAATRPPFLPPSGLVQLVLTWQAVHYTDTLAGALSNFDPGRCGNDGGLDLEIHDACPMEEDGRKINYFCCHS